MPPSVSPLRELMQVAGTLLIAAVGGIGFHLIGFPGGLVSGSMLTVAVAALAGCAVKIPLPLARLCFVLVGILLGAVVTPATLKGIASWPLSVALLVVAAICMMTATAWYLRLAHGWDALSALLGASPGSMAQVMALSAEFGADVRGVAIVHVMRVLLIVLGLPAGLALFGSTVEPVVSTLVLAWGGSATAVKSVMMIAPHPASRTSAGASLDPASASVATIGASPSGITSLETAALSGGGAGTSSVEVARDSNDAQAIAEMAIATAPPRTKKQPLPIDPYYPAKQAV